MIYIEKCLDGLSGLNVRKTTISNFKTICKNYEGSFKKFQQGKGLALHWRTLSPESQSGVCSGLSASFLGLHKIEGKINPSGDTDRFLMKYSERLAQYGTMNPRGNIRTFDSAMNSISVGRSSAIINCTTATLPKLALKSPSSRTFIATKGHACAAVTDKSKGLYVFFDPNFGYAKLPSSVNFSLFVKDFFNTGTYSSPFSLIWTK
ncbi:YopT-type cysteine protease domain-containing protein [Pseudoalteromonas sp. NBT06-2]|uniref:YopT-type cysteine protease domain-containing protein n=1 Tax=Pseudoalteromonas sp. NBT06-2 TaxID=2025950 RepID=UPI0014830DD7|nr:YopT-type cysteine protease domain-containing protein [Pseudoalteromonas sp. NBT06-2]